MTSLKFTNQTVTDGILLISGAGDRSTGGGICVLVDNQIKVIDRVSTAGMILFEGRLGRLLRTPLTTGGGEILIYDARGISHYLRVDELSDPHYLIWNGQHLIVTSTGNDSLLWLTLSGEVMKRWQAPDSGGSDSWHLNDIWLVDEHLYACAFGKYRSYRAYKDHLTNGDGFIFNVGSGETVAGGLCAPHSPRYFDGAWTVCDSLRNSLVQFDPQGRWQRQVQLRSFTRGLAVSEDYLVVGESIPRRTAAVLEMGSVAVLRRSDFSFVARFEVPFEEVGDVVVIPRYLLNALCKGFRTNPLRASEADQLQLFRDVGIEPIDGGWFLIPQPSRVAMESEPAYRPCWLRVRQFVVALRLQLRRLKVRMS